MGSMSIPCCALPGNVEYGLDDLFVPPLRLSLLHVQIPMCVSGAGAAKCPWFRRGKRWETGPGGPCLDVDVSVDGVLVSEPHYGELVVLDRGSPAVASVASATATLGAVSLTGFHAAQRRVGRPHGQDQRDSRHASALIIVRAPSSRF